jgi:hypothetical protein
VGNPVVDAAVAVVAVHQATKTDARGRFTLDRIPAGKTELSVRRLGFSPRTLQLALDAAVDSLRIVLAELPEILDAVNVSATDRFKRQMVEEFYWRRARGLGKYLTREDIASRRASTPSEALRNTPGIRSVRTSSGTGVRFTAIQQMRNTGCIPLIWLDGQRSPGMEIDEISLGDIEGIELYTGTSTTPPQFWVGTSNHCGTIVIWTRVPGTP